METQLSLSSVSLSLQQEQQSRGGSGWGGGGGGVSGDRAEAAEDPAESPGEGESGAGAAPAEAGGGGGRAGGACVLVGCLQEERRHMKEEIERRRMEAAERRMKNLSTCSAEEEEPFSPLSPKSPSFKSEGEEKGTGETACSITERTESLNRSLKKSSSVKKTPPPLLTSRIDNKLEQYSHAVEEARQSRQGVVDIPCPPEPVASKKSLFEAGDAWSQSSPRTTPSKDTEGLKVGVADLITQWVKGNPETGSRNTPSKPADIKAGDVLHKKNMWESIKDCSSSERSGFGPKGTPSGKRYKFVVTGHGKYEKIPVDDGEYDAYENGKSTGLFMTHHDS